MSKLESLQEYPMKRHARICSSGFCFDGKISIYDKKDYIQYCRSMNMSRRDAIYHRPRMRKTATGKLYYGGLVDCVICGGSGYIEEVY